MLGAIINNYHTGDDFGLGWIGMDISSPELKTHYIEIEGRDGVLDATESLSGRPVYKQRTLVLTFDARGSWESYMKRCSKIDASTHGQYAEIVLDIDPKYYWVGRGKWKHAKTADGDETHIFTATVDPYKYQRYETKHTVAVDGTKSVIVENLQAPSYPLLSTNEKDIQVKFGTVTYPIPVGTDTPFYEISFLEGYNELVFSGVGEVTIKYQEGML